jgi:hypothetical protein
LFNFLLINGGFHGKVAKVTHIADENYNVQTLSYQIKANNFGTIRIPSLVEIGSVFSEEKIFF